MKIVLDLQGAQSDSRFRGIGRYSCALAKAIIQEGRQHEIWVVLNARIPESIEPLRAQFENLLPRDRIRVFQTPGPVAELDLANAWRMQAAELLRENFLADLQPDIVHMSTLFEGFHNEVVASIGRLDSSIPTAVTLYDLIPLLQPERFLSKAAIQRAYLRRAESLKRADLLLAISESSRREAVDNLQIPASRIVNIAAGVDPAFRRFEISPEEKVALMARVGLRRPFILYMGGLEPRKNLEALVAAFSLIPRSLRAGYQIAVTGKLHQSEVERIATMTRQHGLAEHEVVCIGYASDEDLRALYNACTVFVFPSLHEGFGLPLVEAMACGAPVLGSNCTSIPEIINRRDALFDPRNVHELAERLKDVLAKPEWRRELVDWGQERACAFTWERSARTALGAFEALQASRGPVCRARRYLDVAGRRRLAFIAPPSETRIESFSTELLGDLTSQYDITCIVDQPETQDPWITANLTVHDVSWFEANAGQFDRILYWFGDGPGFQSRLDLLSKFPGVVALSEFTLGNALGGHVETGQAANSFHKALYDSHGYAGLILEQSEGKEAATKMLPCNAQVLGDSLGVIVNSSNAFELTRQWFGDRAVNRLRLVPSLPLATAHPEREGARNAHDSAAGLPDSAVVKLPVNFSNNSLSDALTPVYREAYSLEQIADGRRFFPRQSEHPECTARLYAEALEEFYADGAGGRETRTIRAIAQIQTTGTPADADLWSSAVALAGNRDRFGLPQLFVDITILAKFDARTGIQRVTRGILKNLLLEPPAGYRVEPIRAVPGGYAYARNFACGCLGLPDVGLADEPIEVGRDDIFLGLDWCADVVPPLREWFLEQRRRGLRMTFVTYDVLPLVHPEFFDPGMPPIAREWIKTVAQVADGVVCISRTVANELHQWLNRAGWTRLRPMGIGTFHLGADLHASLPSTGFPADSVALIEKLRSRPSFLMVGTLEPRKGYRQALAAMELLWAGGTDANLVIIGKRGWMMDDFAEQLRQHVEHGRRLFWLEGTSDEMLEQVYRSVRALVAPSEGEGFGLPLIEAAQYGLPIIARDLPVFQEVAGEHAYYFHGKDPKALADALRTWLALGDAAPRSTGMSWQTWEQSAKQLVQVVLDGEWRHTWPATGPALQAAGL